MKVFYHSADLDGHCSGAIVKRKHPEAECIGVNYGDPFPWETIAPGEEVWMVDFSLQPFEDMERLNSLCRLTWIDHHKTAIEEATRRDFTPSQHRVLRTDYAACELAWIYCYSSDSMPRSVFLLGRYDIWKHAEIEDALPFQYGMRLQPNTYPTNRTLWNRVFDETDFYLDVVRAGRVCMAFAESRDAKVCKASAFEVNLDGLHCIALNETMGNSQTFKSVWDPAKYDAMLCFYWKRTQWTVSLFTDKPDVDVSIVAKARGGGGHKGAAGFQCAVLPWAVTPQDVAQAITTIEHSRQTHLDWIKFAQDYPNHPADCPDCAKAANDPAHHEVVVKQYDQVLKVLRAVQEERTP